MLSEKGQAIEAIIIIALIVVVAFALIGAATAEDRCAIGFWEFITFWKNYCHAPFPIGG